MSAHGRYRERRLGRVSGLVVLGATWLGSGAAAEAAGEILVVDENAGTEGRRALFVVSPTRGQRGVEEQ